MEKTIDNILMKFIKFYALYLRPSSNYFCTLGHCTLGEHFVSSDILLQATNFLELFFPPIFLG